MLFLRYGHRNAVWACSTRRWPYFAPIEDGPRSSANCRRRPACRGRQRTDWRPRSKRTGWCAAMASGRFELGPAPVTLGRAASERFPLIESAMPVLEDVARDDRRERAAVRPRGRRPPLRDVARIAPRPALDRARGVAVAARPRVVRPGAARRDRPAPDSSRASASASRASPRSAPRSSTRPAWWSRRCQRQRPDRAPQPHARQALRPRRRRRREADHPVRGSPPHPKNGADVALERDICSIFGDLGQEDERRASRQSHQARGI